MQRVRHRMIVILLSITGLLAPVQAMAQNYKFGMVTSVLDPSHGGKMTELGAGYVRLNFYWWLIEPAQDDYRWGDVDRWLSEAATRNLKVFASLTETAPWAGPCQFCMPYQILDWYDFVWQVIKHAQVNFPGLDIVFGIWNEPNLHFLDDDAFASQYKLLFQYADLARDDANPGARLAGPETSHHAVFDNNYFAWAMDRIQPYLNLSDKITVHWYPDGGNLSGYMSQVNSYSEGQEVWLTETGYSTCNDSEQTMWISHIMNTFETTSAAFWTKTLVYVLYNGQSCTEAVVRPDWTNRQAFDWYRDWIATH